MWKKSLISLIGMFGIVLMLSSCLSHSFVGIPDSVTGGDQGNNNNGRNAPNVDTTPPVGFGVFFSQTTATGPVTVSWLPATDDVTPQKELQYKLVASTSATDVNSLDKADAVTGNAILLMDWTAGVTTQDVSGLSADTNYYFAVLVKDAANNKALYLTDDWVAVGISGFSAGEASNILITVDSLNVPYVSYSDAGDGSYTKIMKFDNESLSWNPVDPGIPSLSGYQMPTPIATDSSNKLYACYATGSEGIIAKFDGTSSSVVGTAELGFPLSRGYCSSMTINSKNDDPYMAFIDGNQYYATIMSFNKLGPELDPTLNVIGAAGFSITTPPHIAVNSKGVPYIAYGAQVSCGAGCSSSKSIVKKFVGTSWVDVGTIEAYYLMSIAIDSKDAIYVLDLGATVQKFDETETVPSWTVVGVPNILKQTNGLSLAIDSNDVIYVAAAGQMKRFDGTSWVTVGRPLSQGNSNASGSLAIGTDNVPVMAYNRSPDNKATVVKLGITIPNFTTMSVCPLHNLNMCDMCAGMMDMCVQMGF